MQLSSQIDVVRYSTNYIFGGFDYTDEIKPPIVELAGNQLTIAEPPQVQLRVASFNKEFTITQFTDEVNFYKHYNISGIEALVIRVPANVEVVTNQNDNEDYLNN